MIICAAFCAMRNDMSRMVTSNDYICFCTHVNTVKPPEYKDLFFEIQFIIHAKN